MSEVKIISGFIRWLVLGIAGATLSFFLSGIFLPFVSLFDFLNWPGCLARNYASSILEKKSIAGSISDARMWSKHFNQLRYATEERYSIAQRHEILRNDRQTVHLELERRRKSCAENASCDPETIGEDTIIDSYFMATPLSLSAIEESINEASDDYDRLTQEIEDRRAAMPNTAKAKARILRFYELPTECVKLLDTQHISETARILKISRE